MPPAIKNAIITAIIAIGMSPTHDKYKDWFIGQYQGSLELMLWPRLGGRKPHFIFGGVEEGEHAI